MMIEILSEEKRNMIKQLLNCLDIGLTDFNYGCICNHIKVENGIVTNTITGFDGRGKTDSLAVLNLIENIWEHLSPQEKQRIEEILNENTKD